MRLDNSVGRVTIWHSAGHVIKPFPCRFSHLNLGGAEFSRDDGRTYWKMPGFFCTQSGKSCRSTMRNESLTFARKSNRRCGSCHAIKDFQISKLSWDTKHVSSYTFQGSISHSQLHCTYCRCVAVPSVVCIFFVGGGGGRGGSTYLCLRSSLGYRRWWPWTDDRPLDSWTSSLRSRRTDFPRLRFQAGPAGPACRPRNRRCRCLQSEEETQINLETIPSKSL